MKASIFIVSLFLLASCSTIHYRFEGDSNGRGDTKWHHIGILDFVEYSDPAKPKNFCNEGVAEVTTRKSAGQVILGLIPYLGFFWSPREVSFTCAGSVASNAQGAAAVNAPVAGSGNTNGGVTNNNNININISPEMFEKKKKQ